MAILFHGITDIGRKRKTNQDAIFMSRELNFFLVADGMGGHKGGDIASALAIRKAPEFLEQNPDKCHDYHILAEAYKYTNQSIFQEAVKNPHLRGMGTTMVSLYFIKSNLYVANVGDSRAYLISKNNLYQLSRDHSLVQEKMNLGIYSREEAQKDRLKNVLVRTVGFEENLEVDLFSYKVSRYDIIFVCSDGLHGKISDRDIHHLINKHLPDPSQATEESIKRCVEDLVHHANLNGGQDNISLILTVAK